MTYIGLGISLQFKLFQHDSIARPIYLWLVVSISKVVTGLKLMAFNSRKRHRSSNHRNSHWLMLLMLLLQAMAATVNSQAWNALCAGTSRVVNITGSSHARVARASSSDQSAATWRTRVAVVATAQSTNIIATNASIVGSRSASKSAWEEKVWAVFRHACVYL